jgi:hypothetical protein
MRKPGFILFILFFPAPLLAQQSKQESKWAASITGAFIPLPGFNAGIQPGLVYRFNDRFSLLTEITIRVGNKADRDSEAVDKKYFRIQPELRYRISALKSKNNVYAGFRCSYSIRQFADVNNGFYSINDPRGDDGYYYDKARISSPVLTTSLQAGTIFSAGKKLSIDLFTGIGARFIQTTYTDVLNPVKGVRSKPADGPVFYASYSYNGSLTWFHLDAGVRLIYHFGQ